ncbi:MAG: protein phosphatase 2C domain-containing protein, partial [Byssovorax sp.]
MSRTLTLKAAGRTDIGRVRETNQDALLVREDLGLFVVADGMDGRATGEIASAIAVKAIEGFIEPFGTDWPCDTIGAPTDALARLVAAVIHANQRIYQIAVKDPSPRWMGTTVVAALVRRNSVCLAHVGDSRIYRLRN